MIILIREHYMLLWHLSREAIASPKLFFLPFFTFFIEYYSCVCACVRVCVCVCVCVCVYEHFLLIKLAVVVCFLKYRVKFEMGGKTGWKFSLKNKNIFWLNSNELWIINVNISLYKQWISFRLHTRKRYRYDVQI